MSGDRDPVNPYYSRFLYTVGQAILVASFRILWRLKVSGLENVPQKSTGLILAANHRSFIDPPLVGSCLPYHIYYFAKEELFDIPLLGWYIRRVNSFPVSRMDHDVGAFKTALKVLKHDRVLMLFPEGGRRLDPRRQFVAKPGVAMLAAKAQVPVIPVGVIGADRIKKLARLEVRFGRPVPPPAPDDKQYQAYSDDIMRRIKELCHAS